MEVLLGKSPTQRIDLEVSFKYTGVLKKFFIFTAPVDLHLRCHPIGRDGFTVKMLDDCNIICDITDESFTEWIRKEIQYTIMKRLNLRSDFTLKPDEYSFEILQMTIHSPEVNNVLVRLRNDTLHTRRGEIIQWLESYEDLQRACNDTLEKGKLYMQKTDLEKELHDPEFMSYLNMEEIVRKKLKSYNIYIKDHTGTLPNMKEA